MPAYFINLFNFIQFRKSSVTALMLLMVVITIGYSQYAVNPVIKMKEFSEVKSIGILPIDFDFYYLTAGGIQEYHDSGSIAARARITDHIKKTLSEYGYEVVLISDDVKNSDEWKHIRNLYDAVNSEIQTNVFGYSHFPEAESRFSYSLPPVQKECNELGIDAIFFCKGF